MFDRHRLFPNASRLFALTIAGCLGIVPQRPVAHLSAADCNLNRRDDSADLSAGSSADCNGNGVPDECELVPVRLAARDRSQPLDGALNTATSGDFNGDGQSDLLVTEQVSVSRSTVQVLLSQGDGTFLANPPHNAGANLSALTTADFDRDGTPDVATANFDRILVLRGDRAGFLEPALELPMPQFTRFVTAADLDGDGAPDLLATAASDDAISIVRNHGDDRLEEGAFAAPTSLPVGDSPVSIIAVDLDLDGDLDIAVANKQSDDITILIQHDEDSFEDGAQYPAALRKPRQVAATDIDSDGDPDLLLHNAGTMTILANDGSGSFALFSAIATPIAQVSAISSVVPGDLDGDGDVDLAVGSDHSSLVVVLTNSGGGRYVSPANVTLELIPSHLVATDHDGEGTLELIAFSKESRQLVVLWQGEQEALAFESFDVAAGAKPHDLAIGDADGDGILDILTANGGGGTVSVFLGLGDGTLAAPIGYRQGGYRGTIALGDLDSDGDLDVVTGDAVGLLENDGEGSFRDITEEPLMRGAMVTTADLDGDGAPEIIAADATGNQIHVLHLNGELSTPRSSRLESFRPEGTSGPWSVAPEDFDRDGDIDLAVGYRSSANVAVFWNDGAAGFPGVDLHPAVAHVFYVVAADLNSDGLADLATANGNHNTVSLFLNEQVAAFTAAGELDLGRYLYSLRAADLNNDGFTDLISVSEQESSLSVNPGAGDGSFAPPFHYPVGIGQRFVVAGDLDRDGDNDLVSGNREGWDVTVLLNKSASAPASDDFLTTVCTALDFERLSLPVSGQNGERTLRFIVSAPVTKMTPGDTEPLPTLFENTRRFPDSRTFLTAVFPERFADLADTTYDAFVLRRATRRFFVGTLQTISLGSDDQPDPVYAFDVVTDPEEDEILTREEIRGIYDTLRESFLLEPLGYAPASVFARERAALWSDTSFPVYISEPAAEPPPGQPPRGATPTFELVIPDGTVICGVFAEAGATRGPRDEYELKSRTRLHAGVIALTTTEEFLTQTLVDELVIGRDRETAIPVGAGRFRLLRIPGADDVTRYRFTYAQEFLLEDGRSLAFELVAPLQYSARGEEWILGRVELDEAFFVAEPGTEAFVASVEGVPLVRYGSCSYGSLPLWEIDAKLADGTSIGLREHFEPAESLFRTAPVGLSRADITWNGERRTVTDYWDLVYSASRHNCRGRYWAVLDRAIEPAGATAPVRVVELQAADRADCLPAPLGASARYLGEDLEVVGEPAVVSFTRRRVDKSAARFVRGDTNNDGRINLADPVTLLEYLFRHESAPACRKAGDANDDGKLTIVDPILLLQYLLGHGPLLPAPYPECGEDPTEDTLPCEAGAECGGAA